jgi:glutamine amidotransferase
MITIVDYKAGNLTSVRLAFEHLGIPARVTADPVAIRAAERLYFPGVGAAGSAMQTLRSGGLAEVLRETADRGVPFLGVCLGMQVLFDRSDEDGGTLCLGLFPGAVRRFRFADPRVKIPHMGWNAMRPLRPHPLFAGIEPGSEFYFVHSFYTEPAVPADRLGETEYGGFPFTSAVARRNVAATQFHPEKSGRIGLQLLANFAKWDGTC